jgi:hypothetical protein
MLLDMRPGWGVFASCRISLSIFFTLVAWVRGISAVEADIPFSKERIPLLNIIATANWAFELYAILLG